jgi:hypothetical protein
MKLDASFSEVFSPQPIFKKTSFGNLSKVSTFGNFSTPSTPQKPLPTFSLFASTPATVGALSTPVLVLQQPLPADSASDTPSFKFKKPQTDLGLRSPRYKGKNVPYGKDMRDTKSKPQSSSGDHVPESAPLPEQSAPGAFRLPSGFNWGTVLGSTPDMITPPPVLRDQLVESPSFKTPSDAFSFSAGPVFGRPQRQPPLPPSVSAEQEPAPIYVGSCLTAEEAKVCKLLTVSDTGAEEEQPATWLDSVIVPEEVQIHVSRPAVNTSTQAEEIEKTSGVFEVALFSEPVEGLYANDLLEETFGIDATDTVSKAATGEEIDEEVSHLDEEQPPAIVSIFNQTHVTADANFVNIFASLERPASDYTDSDDESSEASDDDGAQSDAAHDLDAIEPLIDEDLIGMDDDEVGAGSVDGSQSESAASVDASSASPAEDTAAIEEDLTTVAQSAEDDEDVVVSFENGDTTVAAEREVTDVEQSVEEEEHAPASVEEIITSGPPIMVAVDKYENHYDDENSSSMNGYEYLIQRDCGVIDQEDDLSSSDDDYSSDNDTASDGSGLTSPSLGYVADDCLAIDPETAEEYFLEGWRRSTKTVSFQDEDDNAASDALDVSEKDGLTAEIDAPAQKQWFPKIAPFDLIEFDFITHITDADFDVPSKLELNSGVFNGGDWALDTLTDVLAPAESTPEVPELDLDLTPFSDMFGGDLFMSVENSCDEIVVLEKTLEIEHVEHESRMLGLTQLLKQTKLDILSIDNEPETKQVAQQLGFSVITAIVTEPASGQEDLEPQQTGKPATGHATKKVRFHLAASKDRDGLLHAPQHPRQDSAPPSPRQMIKKLETRLFSTTGRDCRLQKPAHSRRSPARSIPYWLDEVHTNVGTNERGERALMVSPQTRSSGTI